MASQITINCPLCNKSLAPEKHLEQHLLDEHQAKELAKSLVAEWEALELGDYS